MLAPEIGRDLGIAPKLVGAFVGIVYAGSMAASLASGMFIERHGPIRVSQVCVLLCAAGLLIMGAGTAISGTTMVALALAPVIIGLGYGPITPASSELLARTASPSRMALTFSIKQTGVPAGAALSGAVLPILALRFGWHAAFALIAAAGVAVAAMSQVVRSSLDAGRAPARAPSVGGILAPLRELVRNDAIVELVLAAFVYAALQVCLVSFIVVYLTESLGYSLVAAGLALTVANVAGVVGRIAWGGFADFHLAPRDLLGWLGIASGGCAFVDRGLRRDLAADRDPRYERRVRGDSDRLERRHAFRGRAPRPGEPRGRNHRRFRIRHFRRRNDRTSGLRPDFRADRRIPLRIRDLWVLTIGCGVWLLARRTK